MPVAYSPTFQRSRMIPTNVAASNIFVTLTYSYYISFTPAKQARRRHKAPPPTMVNASTLTALLLVALGSLPAHSVQTRGFCATGPPNALLKAEYQKLQHQASEDGGRPGGGGGGGPSTESRKIETPIEIDTWFHIVSTPANAGLVTDEMIKGQLSALQNAYQGAQISYRLQGVTRHVNESWARNTDELGMKTALRRGSYRTLNVYFHTDLEHSGSGAARGAAAAAAAGEKVLGFCSLPDPGVNASSPRAAYVKDGCDILGHTMPGGPIPHYSRGGTAIHEIGHWNGLLHVFEGDSCQEGADGDYIADTPQQGSSTEGCPGQKNSCPELPGEDSIHNYMDYSSDDCYEAFTPGQLERMRYMWGAMREGK
ncbi:hypothetical protein BDV59DRAFT_197348 [Aspergillus ambiguus]|uniref:zinc metalloprotease n=1 Tax=Aspergillus ambiguus TaxID=176160 RepID=UPI003CCD3F4B